MCGEKRLSLHSLKSELGSPPHVRGKDEVALGQLRRAGITPACAGKRFLQVANHQSGMGHPRMCGEKGMIGAIAVTIRGSPPHVRGKA